MANANIRTSECAWANIQVKIMGRTIKGLRGFSYKKTVEKEHTYGAGNQPLDISTGNIKYEGSIKVLGFELNAMNAAAQVAGYDDISEIPHEMVVITAHFQKTKADRPTFVTVSGVAFSEMGSELEQNAKLQEVTLPFLAMNIEHVTL